MGAGERSCACHSRPCQVVLKLLGQHTEPEHMSYLLSQAPQEKLGSLHIRALVEIIMGLEIKVAVPLPTLHKLKEVRTPRCTTVCTAHVCAGFRGS